MLLNAANAERDMGALIERVLEYRVCAIVVMNGTPPSRIVKECLGNGVPVILVNKPMPGFAVDTVVTDHAAGGRAAAEQLLAAGCRRLAVVSSGARTASLRGASKRSAIGQQRRACPFAFGRKGPPTIRPGREAALAMLAEEAIDGAFCVTDLIALGFLDAARLDRGRLVPDDLSVIGFDDIPQAAWSAYQLTTFRQPVRMLTDQVMHVIRQRAETPESPHAVFTLPASLVVRKTVRGLACAGKLDVTKPQVVAHRGSSAAHAENSWAAFEAAVADGADAIECDVQGTRDGVLVIRHDLAIGDQRVAERAFADIEAMEPGLVRLAELLAWAPRKKIGLLVEVKDPDCAMPVGEMVAASPWRERIVIGGFHGPALAALKARTPEIRTSLMMGSVVAPEDLVRLAKAYHADGVHPCWEARSPHPHRLLDAAAMNAASKSWSRRHALARGARKRIAGAGRASPRRNLHQRTRDVATNRRQACNRQDDRRIGGERRQQARLIGESTAAFQENIRT